MNHIEELEARLEKRDHAMQQICDLLWHAAAFGVAPSSNAILEIIRASNPSDRDIA